MSFMVRVIKNENVWSVDTKYFGTDIPTFPLSGLNNKCPEDRGSRFVGQCWYLSTTILGVKPQEAVILIMKGTYHTNNIVCLSRSDSHCNIHMLPLTQKWETDI